MISVTRSHSDHMPLLKKRCAQCQALLPIDSFHKRASSCDGYRTDCKTCQNEYNKQWRIKNREKVRAYHRNWRATDDGQKREKEYRKKARRSPPLLRKARQMVSDYRRAGKIQRPDRCMRCNAVTKLQAHHEDYHDPLNVIWLCVLCHVQRHEEINEEMRTNPEKWARRGFLPKEQEEAA